MLRRYLINIHRFYHYYYPNSFDHAIMPVVVFSLSLNLFLYIVDSLLFDKLIFIQLANIHDYMVTVPTYMILLLTYLWYRIRLPSNEELKNFDDGRWVGVSICVILLLCSLIVSVYS